MRDNDLTCFTVTLISYPHMFPTCHVQVLNMAVRVQHMPTGCSKFLVYQQAIITKKAQYFIQPHGFRHFKRSA